MKKLIAMLLALAMMLALVACGGGNSNSSNDGFGHDGRSNDSICR